MHASSKPRKRAHDPPATPQLHGPQPSACAPPTKRARGTSTAGPAAKGSTRRRQSILPYSARADTRDEDATQLLGTPEATKAASTHPGSVKSVLGEASKEVQAMYNKLPAKYARLCDMFGKLQTVCAVQCSRGQRCTLQSIQPAMENHCSHRFTMSNLAQLKFIFPEAIHLDWVTVKSPPGSSTVSARQQLLIQLTRRQCTDDSPAETPGSSALQLRQSFTRLLFAHLLEHYRASQQPQARCDCSSQRLEAAAAADWDAAFDVQSVPAVPEAELPLRPSFSAGIHIGSPLSPQVTPRAPHRSHPHPIFSLGKPSLSKGAKQGRRLSIGLQGIRPLESHSTNSDAAASKEQSNSEKLAEQLRRQSAEGTLPVSLSALKAVSEQEARQKALMDKDVMAQRRRAHNLTVLPQLYDSLRALYGLTGPSTRPLPQVVQSLAGSRGSSQAPEDIKAQLQELAALCPDFLSIDQAREGPGSIVRVNRKAAAKAVRQTLVKAASERHAIFQLQL